MLLSKRHRERSRDPPASMSAVSSTTTGGLPGPAVIARLSVLQRLGDDSGPPVTISNRTRGCRISSCADAMVGCAIVGHQILGPPPVTTLVDQLTRFAENRLALGWTLKTTPLPAETIAMELLMTVAVGLVVGVIAPITPKGAYSVTVIPWSPVTASARDPPALVSCW